IKVVSTTRQGRLNPELTHAYSALHAGDFEASHTLYRRVLQSDPLNIDALLGMAYIAAHNNRTEDEIKLYLRILELDPRHGAAQAALIGIMSKADPVIAETRVKQLLAKEPTAFLHFVLGNVYADQSLWSQAQSSYFQAHHLEPENPDYAYNLAIGLDHLRQSKVALNFYRRAEQLAATHGRSHFNPARLRERITALAAQLE
ncbi:MAG TPA: tetratricopeptide repeat protein, partial [Burkholderiales bacterium]|nr:tetratricopeptide repeat protein [Burkholderiales bacterium]